MSTISTCKSGTGRATVGDVGDEDPDEVESDEGKTGDCSAVGEGMGSFR